MIQPALYRFTVKDYECMGRAGILPEDARVELLDGEIYAMTPIGPKHSFAVAQLVERFVLSLSGQVMVVSQSPIHLSAHSEPEPDIVLLRLPRERYQERLPRAEDILLLIEVADSSLAYDRNKKLPVYATAGIPEVWILDLNENRLEVYRKPQGERYSALTTYAEGERAAPLAFEDSALEWWR
ncbi:MAG: Uma2 family endonuclease [Deinococcota bacterium]|jgi:Uma2 family endonuclease|nr:Uma2 family endonuclease [Deinococcota bacterium]